MSQTITGYKVGHHGESQPIVEYVDALIPEAVPMTGMPTPTSYGTPVLDMIRDELPRLEQAIESGDRQEVATAVATLRQHLHTIKLQTGTDQMSACARLTHVDGRYLDAAQPAAVTS